jgi:hypothetical protein
MARYLSNAFSLNMVFGRSLVQSEPISLEAARRLLAADGVVNAIGHVDTDLVVRDLLGVSGLDEGQRLSLVLNPGDELIVAQYRGPRLPEGATSLPEGATIEFLLIFLHSPMGWDELLGVYYYAPVKNYATAEKAINAASSIPCLECVGVPAYEKMGGEVIRAMFVARAAEQDS